MNKLITIGIVGAAAYGIFNLLRMKNVSDEMQIKVDSPRIHKVDWSGITLKTDAIIGNPTKDTMTITKPVITLTSNGSSVAASRPENVTIQIKPLTETKITSIELPLAWTALTPYVASIIKKIPDLIQTIKGKQTSIGKVLDIPLEMTVSTYADNLFIKSSPQKLN